MNTTANKTTKPQRKIKPRNKWKKYARPGNGALLINAELARKLGESPRTTEIWRNKGIIPWLLLGHRSIRYRLDDVLAALAKRQVKGGRHRDEAA